MSFRLSAHLPPMAGPALGCGRCRHFHSAPDRLEEQIPGLVVMGSGYSAVRAGDGLCAVHERYLSAAHYCAGFEPSR